MPRDLGISILPAATGSHAGREIVKIRRLSRINTRAARGAIVRTKAKGAAFMTVAVDHTPGISYGKVPIDKTCINTIRTLVHGRGAGGELGASRARQWRSRRSAYCLWQYVLRFDPDGPDLAQPRPLRPVGRARVDAALLACCT